MASPNHHNQHAALTKTNHLRKYLSFTVAMLQSPDQFSGDGAMQSGPDADEQQRRKREAIHEAARKLAPKPSDRSATTDPWTLERIEELETQNLRLRVRVDRLEEKPAESVRPRFPHQGPPPTADEMRRFLRRSGWNGTADLL
jgi:hypothetical protein